MNKFNTIEDFFTYAFTQAKTQDQRLAIYFLKEGYMLPTHLEKVTWEDIDLEIGGFRSKNYYVTCWVAMSSTFQKELADYKSESKKNGRLFQDRDRINNLINQLSITLKDYPNISEQIDQLYSKKPNIAFIDIAATQQTFTRDCLDPWRNIEIRDDGKLSSCCRIYSGTNRSMELTEFSSKKLRKNLLEGKLREECSICTIRPKTDINEFNKKINLLAEKHNINRIQKLPLSIVRIEITSNCNLRCVYCRVSEPDYKGKDIDKTNFEKSLRLLQGAPKDVTVILNGHGETTFHPNWTNYAQQIINLGYKLEMITNLSKNYTEEEISLLTKFEVLQISLDSHDEEMMRTIRKAVRPSKIFNQIETIRETALNQGDKPPKISFSVGVYDPSVWTMETFMRKLTRLGTSSVTFWNLVDLEHNKTVDPIFSLSPKKFEESKAKMQNSFNILRDAGIDYEIAGKFIEDNHSNNMYRLTQRWFKKTYWKFLRK